MLRFYFTAKHRFIERIIQRSINICCKNNNDKCHCNDINVFKVDLRRKSQVITNKR